MSFLLYNDCDWVPCIYIVLGLYHMVSDESIYFLTGIWYNLSGSWKKILDSYQSDFNLSESQKFWSKHKNFEKKKSLALYLSVEAELEKSKGGVHPRELNSLSNACLRFSFGSLGDPDFFFFLGSFSSENQKFFNDSYDFRSSWVQYSTYIDIKAYDISFYQTNMFKQYLITNKENKRKHYTL